MHTPTLLQEHLIEMMHLREVAQRWLSMNDSILSFNMQNIQKIAVSNSADNNESLDSLAAFPQEVTKYDLDDLFNLALDEDKCIKAKAGFTDREKLDLITKIAKRSVEMNLRGSYLLIVFALSDYINFMMRLNMDLTFENLAIRSINNLKSHNVLLSLSQAKDAVPKEHIQYFIKRISKIQWFDPADFPEYSQLFTDLAVSS